MEAVITKPKKKIRIKPPKLYKVIILNDNRTTFEFVMSILQTIFEHNFDSANKLTHEIHEKGKAIAGIYSLEIAEQKQHEATFLAKNNAFPLAITIESE